MIKQNLILQTNSRSERSGENKDEDFSDRRKEFVPGWS